LSEVVLSGGGLTLEHVLAVARHDARVSLGYSVIATMARSRAVVERALERGAPAYGLTTGVAALKRERVEPSSAERFNQALIREHRIAQGPLASAEVVRAATLRLVNHFASGVPGVRPVLAERMITCLNEGMTPPVRLLGSLGMSDLGPNADLAAGLLDGFALQAGEGLAFLNHSAVSTGLAALAVADAARLLDSATAVAALSMEGFGANLTLLHPAVARTRPNRGLGLTLERIRALLEGSHLWREGAARNLQDPLTLRSIPQVHGAAQDALAYTGAQLAIELNSSQGNPIVVPEEDRVISVANFDVIATAAAIDFLRIALAPVLTAAAERTTKLLESSWSGLESGLSPARTAEPGLGELDIAAAAMAAEARLLAQPVSFEVSTTSIAEGIEDRMTMFPLASRRLAEMVALGERIVAIEWLTAAQAAEIRGASPLGRGTGALVARVRQQVPTFRTAADFPVDLEPVVALVREGVLD